MPVTDIKPALRKDRVRMLLFVKKREDLSYEEFSRYWKEVHAPIFLGIDIVKKDVLLYEQLHVNQEVKKQLQAAGTQVPKYDGVVVIEVESLEKVLEVNQNPEYVEKVFGDAKNLFKMDNLEQGLYQVATILDESARTEKRKTKLFIHVVKKDDMNYDEFSRYWREVHGPSFVDLRSSTGLASDILKNEQLHVFAEGGANAMKALNSDGISIMEAEKFEHIMETVANEKFIKFAAEDGPNFVSKDKPFLFSPFDAVTFIDK
ncbi:hypothetical protein V5O48_001465 [Marasmius crinis-equi]|uniref:EthD domain-containing protein n=1 Tax=Marasmius crinis-equi TaxID=585013 RepID=A0ABR3FYC5_9AGAR